MRQLQLMAHGEPADVIELVTVPDPVLGQEDVLVSMEAAPLNPSDFLLVRGIYGVRPGLPFSLGAEGVGRVVRTGPNVDAALLGKRVLILPTYEQGTWADHVIVTERTIVPMPDGADPLQLANTGPRTPSADTNSASQAPCRGLRDGPGLLLRVGSGSHHQTTVAGCSRRGRNRFCR